MITREVESVEAYWPNRWRVRYWLREDEKEALLTHVVVLAGDELDALLMFKRIIAELEKA